MGLDVGGHSRHDNILRWSEVPVTSGFGQIVDAPWLLSGGPSRMMRLPRPTILLLIAPAFGWFLGVTTPPVTSADTAVLAVRVVDDLSGSPLQNVDVFDRDAARSHLTDASGQVRLTMAGARTLHLLIRQIGYRFAERTVAVNDGTTDTITVHLARVALTLPPVTTRSPSSCASSPDSASTELAAVAISQLQSSAQHFEAFRRTSPFRVHLVRRTSTLGRAGRVARTTEAEEQIEGLEWGDRYEPGRVVFEGRSGARVSILFLSTLGDSAFWDRHCLTVRPVEDHEGRRLIPLVFSQRPDIHDVDWTGTAWLDSATSVLRRIDTQLVGTTYLSRPYKVDTYVTFAEPVPFIAIPDSVVARWWWNEHGARERRWPDVVQTLSVSRLVFHSRPTADSQSH
jgi:hypothetical protein